MADRGCVAKHVDWGFHYHVSDGAIWVLKNDRESSNPLLGGVEGFRVFAPGGGELELKVLDDLVLFEFFPKLILAPRNLDNIPFTVAGDQHILVFIGRDEPDGDVGEGDLGPKRGLDKGASVDGVVDSVGDRNCGLLDRLRFGVIGEGDGDVACIGPLAGDRAECEVFFVFFGQRFDLGDDLEGVEGGSIVLLIFRRGFTLRESEGPGVGCTFG